MTSTRAGIGEFCTRRLSEDEDVDHFFFKRKPKWSCDVYNPGFACLIESLSYSVKLSFKAFQRLFLGTNHSLFFFSESKTMFCSTFHSHDSQYHSPRTFKTGLNPFRHLPILFPEKVEGPVDKILCYTRLLCWVVHVLLWESTSRYHNTSNVRIHLLSEFSLRCLHYDWCIYISICFNSFNIDSSPLGDVSPFLQVTSSYTHFTITAPPRRLSTPL